MVVMSRLSKILGVAVIGMACVSPTSGWADEDLKNRPQLRVSAEGKRNVSPDKAILTFAVETVGEKLAKVQKDNQDRMKRILNVCEEMDIPSNLIQTTSLNVIPKYPPRPRRSSERDLEAQAPRIIGYQVIHQVNVELRNIELVGKVVDRVLKAGANRFSGVSWGLQNEQPVKLAVLKDAAHKARAKAKTLAEALDMRLVRIINIMEGGVSVIHPESQFRMARPAMAMMESGGEASVSAGEITIRGTVTLIYEVHSP